VTSEILTAEQLAERWQVEKAHVYRLAREGSIPTIRLGRYYRFRADMIDAFERGELELHRIMDEAANESGSSSGSHTFGDACAEWLRYLEQEANVDHDPASQPRCCPGSALPVLR
jgi:excisionase family DNA binding protein